FSPRAMAVPSFARQTGLPCSGCHYNPPQLNAAGRSFKLLGYVDKQKVDAVTAGQDKKHAGLDLLARLPLSAWLEASFTNTKAPQPGTQNGNVEFPQDISLFLPAHGPRILAAFSSSHMTRKPITSAWTTPISGTPGRNSWREKTGFTA